MNGGVSTMRRDGISKRGWWLSLLVAAFVGYLAGDWHAAAIRFAGITPSQSVALRFPEAKADTVAADTVTTDTVAADTVAAEDTAAAPTGSVSAAALKNAQLALLDPEPMVPVVEPPQQPVTLPPPESVSAPAPQQSEPPAEPRTEIRPPAPSPRAAAKARSAAERAARHASRQGFLLNDAQIASIKGRLHLTPDQERMWPAVEAALRNIAYAKVRAARRLGAPESAQTASLDADSAEVQGLKSAAIPLIMSFNDEQKGEVRSLAHVMGLDNLASEF